MSKKEPEVTGQPTVRDHAVALIKQARSLLLTSLHDLDRADRIDFLDMTRIAIKSIEQARHITIAATLPKVKP